MDWLGIRNVPPGARRNFLYEFNHVIPWTVLAGLVEGRFGSIVVSKTFEGSPTLVAIATATPTASYIVSVYWGMLLANAPKIRIQTLFVLGTALFAASAGLASNSPAGAILFILALALSQIFLAGVLTLRPAIWQLNYPSVSRGQITAKLHAANLFVSTIISLAVAPICDGHPGAYRVIFPACAAIGLLSLPWLWKMRIPDDPPPQDRPAEARTAAAPPGDRGRRLGRWLRTLSPFRVSAQMRGILREDRAYSRYLTAQTFLGLSNLMVTAVLTVIITREVDTWGGNVYWISTVLFVAMPRLLTFGSLRQWGGLFDRVGVLRFRVINCWFWTLAAALGLLGELAISHGEILGPAHPILMMACFGLQAIAYGFGMGGGKVAWSLGHLHFAGGAKGDLYMGIHVTLTGVRGTVATLLGVWAWSVLGWGVWLVALAFMGVATFMFARLARRDESFRAGASASVGAAARI